jgi:membrane protease YdiL (CAAX protease family)
MTMQSIEVTSWLTALNNTNSLIKLSLFLVSWAVMWLPIVVPLARLVKWSPPAQISNTQKLSLLTSLYLLAPLLVWGVTKVEGIPLAEFGLTWQVSLLQSILFGLGLGVFGILVIYFIESRLGWLEWQRDKFKQLSPSVLLLLGFALFVSVIEELIFRGLFVTILLENYNVWLTTFISSLIFALLHLVWEQDKTLPQLPGLFLMGIVLVMAKWIDHGSLGLAIGLHAGWVFSLASLDTFELYRYTNKGLGWIAGKPDQPLASMAGVSVLVFTAVLLLCFHIT